MVVSTFFHVIENHRYLRALAQVVDADVLLIFPAEKILVGRWWRGDVGL
jgi:hypothetical protein